MKYIIDIEDKPYNMAEISYTAQQALDEYGTWIAEVLEERGRR